MRKEQRRRIYAAAFVIAAYYAALWMIADSERFDDIVFSIIRALLSP